MEPITLLLSNIKTAIDITKLITETGNNLEKAEINLKLADIISNLANAKIEVSNLKDLINEKDLEIKKLKEKAQKVHELTFVDPIYRNANYEPFCTRCFDSESKIIRVIRVNPSNPEFFKCPECKNSYETEKGAQKRNQSYETAQNNYISKLKGF